MHGQKNIKLFALYAAYSQFCEDDLMRVNLPKHVVKVNLKIKYVVVFDCYLINYLFLYLSNSTGCPV